MSRNGAGTYTLVAGNPVVTGTTVNSTTMNNTLTDLATALTASIANDGQTPILANLPMSGYKHTGVADAALRTQYTSAGQCQDNSLDYLTGVAGTNTITANAAISLAAYAAGQTFRFISAGANTTAVTININSIGAKSITKNGTTALVDGDIPSGVIAEVVYDGTQFQLIGIANHSELQSQTYTAFTTGGTSTAFTLTPAPALTALNAGQRFRVKFNATAGATPTLAISGLTAKALMIYTSAGAKAAASATTIISGMLTDVEYDGTDMVILDPLPASVPVGTIIDFAGAAAQMPSGYLLCDGAAVSRTVTYDSLFAAIGVLWGVGDGSTTFNVPNFPAFYAAVQNNGTVGASTAGVVKAHTHTYNNFAGTGTNSGGAASLANTPASSATGSTGGSDNLAAGKCVLKIIKY